MSIPFSTGHMTIYPTENMSDAEIIEEEEGEGHAVSERVQVSLTVFVATLFFLSHVFSLCFGKEITPVVVFDLSVHAMIIVFMIRN